MGHGGVVGAPGVPQQTHLGAMALAQQGASMQSFNNELIQQIEDLRGKRDEISRSLAKEEEEKVKIQNDLAVLTKRLSQINDSLARKYSSRQEYDRTIDETEGAYMKILESSQTLLTVLKRESMNIQKKKQSAT